MTAEQRALLAGAIDYAGLFPPAGLAMVAAAGNYRRYLAGDHRWALGRFVCPVGRLDELAAARGSGGSVWPIAAVASGEPHEEAAAIARFNQDHFGRLRVETIEAKTPDDHTVRSRIAASSGLECFCELNPASPEFRSALAAVAASSARAKLRTGGTVAAAIPSTEHVVEFLLACHHAGVSFKATAGLHHPYRGCYPLTYEPDAPTALMHGFVNLTLASAAVAAGAPPAAIMALLDSPDPQYPAPLAAVRRFFLSFGCCSFEEPLQWSLLPV
ncbi:MAG: hypothetical protein ACRD0Y_08540 [Terriglobales bacterium]